MPDDPSTPTFSSNPRLSAARWTGVGIGGGAIVLSLVLVFMRECLNPSQAHVLGLVLSLGIALLLWGLVGQLQAQVKLRFPIGEVTGGGVAAVLLIINFTSPSGLTGSDICGQEDDRFNLVVKVQEGTDTTSPIAGAEVSIESATEAALVKPTGPQGSLDHPVDLGSTLTFWANANGYEKSGTVTFTGAELQTKGKLVIPMTKTGTPAETPRYRPELFLLHETVVLHERIPLRALAPQPNPGLIEPSTPPRQPVGQPVRQPVDLNR